MALIDQTSFLKIADRAASQYKILEDASLAAQAEGNGFYAAIVTDTDDPDVEIPMLDSAVRVDTDIKADRMVAVGTMMSDIFWAMTRHFAMPDTDGKPLQSGGWDGYLQEKDLRVSWYFAKFHLAVSGRFMLAIDVFSEGEDVFGTAEVVAGPAIDFVDGIDYGNGSIENPANGLYYAGTQLRVKVLIDGAADLDLRLHVKNLNDNPVTIDVMVPAGTPVGDYVTVGTPADRFLDLTGVSISPGGSAGTLGQKVSIENLKERQIVL